MTDLIIEAIGDFARAPIEGANFKSLMPPNMALPQPPRFFFGPFPEDLSAAYFGHCGLSSVGVFDLRAFELSGVFLLSRGGTYYRCPELNIHESHIQAELVRITTNREVASVRKLAGPHVILAGPGWGIFGHWLVEYLPKIALLHFAGYDIRALRYLIPKDVPKFVTNYLELLTIRPDQLVIYDREREIIRADRLIVPTVMHNGLRMSSIFQRAAYFLKDLVGAHHDLSDSPSGKRIFLSRNAIGGGRMLENREAIENLARDANFEIVFPEKLSLVDQVRLFSNADQVMGEYGSALHGTIFSPPGTVVCALRGTGGHPGFLQSGMGDVLEQPTGYIFGHAHGPERQWGFKVEEDAVTSAIRLVFGGIHI